MLNPSNVVIISGGLVRDPESPANNLIKFSIGVDYSSSEKGNDSSGYFDVVYWVNDNPNGKFIQSQFADGKLKKGSQVNIIGRLVQDRWVADDNSKKSRVVITAESIDYVRGSSSANTGGAATTTASVEVPNSF